VPSELDTVGIEQCAQNLATCLKLTLYSMHWPLMSWSPSLAAYGPLITFWGLFGGKLGSKAALCAVTGRSNIIWATTVNSKLHCTLVEPAEGSAHHTQVSGFSSSSRFVAKWLGNSFPFAVPFPLGYPQRSWLSNPGTDARAGGHRFTRIRMTTPMRD
jgi:hypothetical protein